MNWWIYAAAVVVCATCMIIGDQLNGEPVPLKVGTFYLLAGAIAMAGARLAL